MKKMLALAVPADDIIYYYVNSQKIFGRHKNLTGDVSGLRGYVSGLIGDVGGLTGDLDQCEITVDDRKTGIKITDLVAADPRSTP